MVVPPELGSSCRGHPAWFFLFSGHNFVNIYGGSLERSLDDSLEMPNLLGAGQLGEQVCSGIALPKNIVHFEAFEIIDEGFGNVVVLKQHHLFGLLFIGNLSLDKLRVYVVL